MRKEQVKKEAQVLTAKLLANENITVIQKRVNTASFEIVSRVLTLPQWKGVSETVVDMLIGHEIGHALWTDMSYDGYCKAEKHLRSYLNILEDVRIEKKVKQKYPGMRPVFKQAYAELCAQDMFGIKGKDISKMVLVDRINLYYKADAPRTIFNMEELKLADRALATQTLEDVNNLAKDVYAYEQEHKTDDSSEDLTDQSDEESDEYGEQGDAEPSDGEEGESDEKQSSGKESEEEQEASANKTAGTSGGHGAREPETNKNFDQKMSENLDMETEYCYVTVDKNRMRNPIVPYKTVLEETLEIKPNKEALTAFYQTAKPVVNYLLKEFEMKKAASVYMTRKLSKMGVLDEKQFYAYKISNELFKSGITVKEGKNHGMIFLLDWSGSMADSIQEVIKQATILAMYCHRAQIKYQVFAFSSEYMKYRNNYDYNVMLNKEDAIFTDRNMENIGGNRIMRQESRFSLLELFSSKMSEREFSLMTTRLIESTILQVKGYELGGTPLTSSLIFMADYMAEFKQAYNVDKMALITLTDGASEMLTIKLNTDLSAAKKPVFILKDTLTQRDYQFEFNPKSQVSAVLNMIRGRHNTVVLGFFIASQAQELWTFEDRDCRDSNRLQQITKELTRNGSVAVKYDGYDELFGLLKAGMGANKKQVVTMVNGTSQSLLSFLTDKNKSKILLDKFIKHTA